MWLIAPLIFILAWVKSHSLSQSITESAAWCGGYMASAGVIIALNLGSIHIISEAPDGPGSIIPILVGFVFMWVSHVLWRRRGGHLQRRQVPLTRLAGRAYIAFRGADAAKPASSQKLNGYANVAKRAAGVTQAAAAGRPAPKPATPVDQTRKISPSAPQTPPRTAPRQRSSTPRPSAPRPIKSVKKAPARSKAKTAGRVTAAAGRKTAAAGQQVAHSDGAKKAMSNRWFRGSVRALDGLFNDPKKGSKEAK